MDETAHTDLAQELQQFQHEQHHVETNGTRHVSEEQLLTCLSAETFGGRVCRGRVRVMLADAAGKPVYKVLPVRGVADIRSVWRHADMLLADEDFCRAYAAASEGLLAVAVTERNFLFGLVMIVLGIEHPVTIMYRGQTVWDAATPDTGDIGLACLGLLETFPNGLAIDTISIEIGRLSNTVQAYSEDAQLGNS